MMPKLEENIAAAVAAMGTEPVGLIWGISTHPWKSSQERDEFLRVITGSSAG